MAKKKTRREREHLELQGLDEARTQVPWVEATIAVGVGLLVFALVRTANPSSA